MTGLSRTGLKQSQVLTDATPFAGAGVNNRYFYMQPLPRRGNAVAGSWEWTADASVTEWYTDLKLDTAGYWTNTGAAQNDEYAYPVFLFAGTYSFEIYYIKTSGAGILSLLLGDTTLGTQDMYAAASTYNNLATIAFTIAADTAANLRMVMATKNAASSAYRLLFQRATLWRKT